jgi:hypothetical protein
MCLVADNIRDLWEMLLQKDALEDKFGGHQMVRKSSRSPSLRLRFGRRSDSSMSPVSIPDKKFLVVRMVTNYRCKKASTASAQCIRSLKCICNVSPVTRYLPILFHMVDALQLTLSFLLLQRKGIFI